MGLLNVNPADLYRAADDYTELAARTAQLPAQALAEIQRIAASHGPMGFPTALGIAAGMAAREAAVQAKAAQFRQYATPSPVTPPPTSTKTARPQPLSTPSCSRKPTSTRAATRSAGAATGGALAAQPRRRPGEVLPRRDDQDRVRRRQGAVDPEGHRDRRQRGRDERRAARRGVPARPTVGAGRTRHHRSPLARRAPATSCTNTTNQPAAAEASRCCPRAGSVGRPDRDTRERAATLAANRHKQVQRQQRDVRRNAAVAPPDCLVARGATTHQVGWRLQRGGAPR